jgi:hypothetical protein
LWRSWPCMVMVVEVMAMYGHGCGCNIQYINMTLKSTEPICDIHAVAFACSCLNGDDSEHVTYNIHTARNYLRQCLLNSENSALFSWLFEWWICSIPYRTIL